jgi:hypothetical protein
MFEVPGPSLFEDFCLAHGGTLFWLLPQTTMPQAVGCGVVQALCVVCLLLQVLGISEAKQALLAEAAQQHQQQHQQRHNQQQSDGAAAAAAADGPLGDTAMLEDEDGEEDGSELEGEVDGDADLAVPGVTRGAVALGDAPRTQQQQQQQQQQRRRRSSSGAGAASASVSGGGGGAAAAAAAAAAAPTTLQIVAPKREAVGREEVVGLLAAVMKQRGGRS